MISPPWPLWRPLLTLIRASREGPKPLRTPITRKRPMRRKMVHIPRFAVHTHTRGVRSGWWGNPKFAWVSCVTHPQAHNPFPSEMKVPSVFGTSMPSMTPQRENGAPKTGGSSLHIRAGTSLALTEPMRTGVWDNCPRCHSPRATSKGGFEGPGPAITSSRRAARGAGGGGGVRNGREERARDLTGM